MKLLKTLIAIIGLLTCSLASAQDREALVLIGHPGVPHLDVSTVQRLYTGRAVEVAGAAVVVFNATPGSKLRYRFMATVLNQDDDKYVAYWTVRKHIGKGAPPREVKTAAELIDLVQSTPGAVGYVYASDLKAGLNVVLRP